MTKRALLALLALAATSGFGVVAAQQSGQPQTSKDLPKKITVGPGYKGPPPFTYTGKWYGFITDNKDLRRGYDITPDEVKKAVAGGAHYVLYNNVSGRLDVEPQEKAAQFAGQQVWIKGSITSNIYGAGATSEPSIEGYGGGDGTVATRFTGVKIDTITATVRDDAYADFKVPQATGAGIEADQLQQQQNYGIPSTNSK